MNLEMSKCWEVVGNTRKRKLLVEQTIIKSRIKNTNLCIYDFCKIAILRYCIF